jgi:hypothetical protein
MKSERRVCVGKIRAYPGFERFNPALKEGTKFWLSIIVAWCRMLEYRFSFSFWKKQTKRLFEQESSNSLSLRGC